jgi:Fur family transcriptional regulator, zinc uptake regulator
MTPPDSRFAESRGKHDHRACMSRALVAAEKLCKARDLQLTAIRRRVLELVWNRHAPIGAYDILGALKKGEGAIAPPTVYRALEFLLDAGLIHRIDSLNAFIGCETPEEQHTGQFLVCRSCNRVTELDDPAISKLLEKKAREAGFTAITQSVEIKDVCVDCQASAR